MTHQYKVGILYCKAGQCTEEEMYNNRKFTSSQYIPGISIRYYVQYFLVAACRLWQVKELMLSQTFFENIRGRNSIGSARFL